MRSQDPAPCGAWMITSSVGGLDVAEDVIKAYRAAQVHVHSREPPVVAPPATYLASYSVP
jgi:hypothetical protein